MKLKKYGISLIAVVILCLIDQGTKALAVKYLMGKDPLVLWDGVFELKYLENRGAAFGIFQNQQIFFYILTVIIGIALIWFYGKIPHGKKYFLMKIPVVVCFAGAIGNFIDRAFQGYVVDFFYFKLINFPIFNMADIYITCSAVFFVLLFIFKYRDDDLGFLHSKKSKSSENEQESRHE
ncbi:signal peptidase II [Catenibacillus scindens]|uniref:Lipoprotein signal peptidase n=1 Tax=Catenibacillus scindens TaxID=673271 RepID=A0A7W8M415_9FIRM|nr:signal peptidase II [Catenibacillus scindens]MBB5263678.1 signal peptidase II [Catenibacillus scindens]